MPAEIAADPGTVKSQVTAILLPSPHCTWLAPLAVPTPLTLPTIICEELIGMPKKLAVKITIEALISAAKPCDGEMRVILNPTVRIILKPPEAVPTPMVTAHAKITQRGISTFCKTPPAKRPKVMIPMLFCASFTPCDKAIRLADPTCK